jgi:serine/threonine protein kinase/DNA-binding PadR family transcriptional regulator
MDNDSLKIPRNSRNFWILQALDLEPEYWFSGIEVKRRVDAIPLGARIGLGGLYNALGGLTRRGLIDQQADSASGRRRYRINEAGRQTIRSLDPEPFPWPPGHILRSERATYRIRQRFRYSGRGLMFVAEVVSVETNEPLPDWFGPNALVMLKTVRPVDNAVADSARYLQVVNEALDLEKPTLKRLVKLRHVVDTVDWGRLNVLVGRHMGPSPRPLEIRYIVQRRLEGCQHLSGYLRQHKITAEIWWAWARALASGLRGVHSQGTLHRDIRPENIVISSTGPADPGTPIFVDIGEAVFRKVGRPEDDRDGKTLDDSYTAPEQRGGHTWPSRRADLYSLGAVLYFMVKGSPPDFLCVDDEVTKETVERSLRSTENGIVRNDFAIADVISRCLCWNPERRVQSADELLQDLNVRPPQRDGSHVLASLDKTRSLLSQLMDRQNDVFLALCGVEIDRLNEVLEGMVNNARVIIEGNRDTIVRRLSTYIAALRGRSRYVATTIPRFWSPLNLGIRSRYSAENLEFARAGGEILRLLVLTHDDRIDPIVHNIVRMLLQMQADCETLRNDAKPHQQVGRIETRFIEVSADKRARMVRTGEQRGIWIGENSAVSLIPAYDSKGVIRAVALIRSNRDDEANGLSAFYRLFNSPEAKPLAVWGDDAVKR